MKKFARSKCRKTFLETIFSKFPHKIFVIILRNITGLENSYCLSANHNPELRCAICTGVALFAPVFHFLHWCYTRTALLSANQNRVIFSCILLTIKKYTPSLHYSFTERRRTICLFDAVQSILTPIKIVKWQYERSERIERVH